MKIGERGQVTIPKKFREKFGLHPSTEVEFVSEKGSLLVRRKPLSTKSKKDPRDQWVGCLGGEGEEVDEFIEEIRGR